MNSSTDPHHHEQLLPPDGSEWIFSLCVPAGVRYTAVNDVSLSNGEEAAAAAEAATATAVTITFTTPRFIHLRQDDDDDRDDFFAATQQAQPTGTTNNANQQPDDDNNNNNNQERISLLHPVDHSNDNISSSSNNNNNTVGWTLRSPFWTLQARNLLTVTYGPAWQALPAYTNRSCSSSSSCCYGCCSSCCCCCCCCCNTPHRDFVSETFSCHDIVAIQRLDHVYITGAGECHGLRVQLRPLQGGASLPDMPTQYQKAWREQVQNIQTNRQVLRQQQQQQQLREQSERSFLNNNDDDDNHDSGDPLTIKGPIITFCLPKSLPDPPLLWKVELPALEEDKPIAMESITVLDGALQTSCSPSQRMPSSSSHHSEKEDIVVSPPTHIFINGFQSWSFAGSIVKGRPQPKSGMPDMFSRAFNYGGSPPPPADVVVSYNNNTPTQGNNSKTPVYRSVWKQHYMSDFFTCITSDAPPKRRRHLRRTQRPPPPYQQLDETGGPALILGWLSQQEQFGVIEVDQELEQFQMHASTHGQILLNQTSDDDDDTKYNSIRTDWAYAQLLHPHSYDEEPLVHYLHAVAAHGHARPLQNGPLLTGWCSWYVFYENINAEILRQNFGTLAKLKKTHVPTNVAVVDDGYMTAWGDWASLKPDAFPGDGLGQVSRDISQHGMRPGLWLAPFAADKHSQLSKDHPDWVIKNDAGAVANSSNCGKFFHGLDASNPAVRKHVYEAIRRAVVDWEYSVLKIDFLYAACLEGNGKYDLSMSRAQAMHLALKTIREAAGPDVFLIGCGCPISSGIGYVDAMRVSADTGPTWYPAWPLPWWDHGTLPALRSMIRNSIARAPFGHRFWHNDPDCLMLGEHTRLTDEEVASAATVVAMTCGMLLLSDDLPKVKPKRMQIVSKIFPLTGVSAVVLDLHSTNDGLPSLMRLWCTDRFNLLDCFRESRDLDDEDLDIIDPNAEATFFAQRAAFRRTEELLDPNERQRSCIHVTKGLGTWTVVSVSNWLDTPAVVHIPPMALITPPASAWDSRRKNLSETFLNKNSSQDDDTAHGYHAFAFWSGKYSWLPDHRHDASSETLSKKLQAHETEIFHIKPVTPEQPQYVGSDLHFSCGKEVFRFRVSSSAAHVVEIWLDTNHRRMGHIFLYIPRVNTDNVKVVVNDQVARWDAVGNTPRVGDNGSPRLAGRVLRIQVTVYADGRPRDGQITVEY